MSETSPGGKKGLENNAATLVDAVKEQGPSLDL